MRNNKGFTLMELIVVIAILGVLALILVPSFMNYLEDAKINVAKTNARNAFDIAYIEFNKGINDEDHVMLKQDLIKAVEAKGIKLANNKISCENDKDRCLSLRYVVVRNSGYEAVAWKDKVVVTKLK